MEADNPVDYETMMETLLHEGRHAYQEYNISTREVMSEREVTEVWAENMEHYIDPLYDYEGYFKQPIEQDARDFASEVILDHFDKLI